MDEQVVGRNLISHHECLGFDSSLGASFIDNETFCVRSGNFLEICRLHNDSLEFLHSINGENTGFSSLSGSPLNKAVAYADQVLNPMVHFVNSSGTVLGTVYVNGVHGIRSIEFSCDGQWVFTLGGLPTFRLSAFSFKDREEVAFQTYDFPIGTKISVFPMKSRTFAVFGDDPLSLPPLPKELCAPCPPHLRFFTLQGCKGHYSLVEVASDLDSNVTGLSWSAKGECIAATSDGRVVSIDPSTGKVTSELLKISALNDGDQTINSILCTSKYLILGGSSGNIYWVSMSDTKNLDDINVLEIPSSISFMRMFPSGDSLLLGTRTNSLCLLHLDPQSHRPDEKFGSNTLVSLRDAHFGAVTGVCATPNYLVTVGDDGTFRFWDSENYLSLKKKFSFKMESFTTVACSKGGSLLAFGSKSGILRIVGIGSSDEPTLLFRERLHSSAISGITITDSFICSSSLGGSVVILRNDAAKSFPLIGLLQMKGGVVSISSPPPLSTSQQLLIATDHREVFRVDIPEEPAEHFLLRIETMNRAVLRTSSKILSILSEPTLRNEQQYFYAACDDKTVKYFSMPLTSGNLDIVGVDESESNSPDDTLVGHLKPVTAVALSSNQRFFASGCSASTIIVRELDSNTAQPTSVLLTATHHSPLDGSISSLCFSPDDTKLFSGGFDGCVNAYFMSAKRSTPPKDKNEPPLIPYRSSVSRTFPVVHQIQSLSEIWQNRNNDNEEEETSAFPPDDDNGFEETPLSAQIKSERQIVQQKEAETFQNGILSQLKNVETEFKTLIQENESAPELEKLTKNDFTIDVASAERLQALSAVRSELILYRRRVKANIRNLISESIISKCWKGFEPKLSSLHSFKAPISFDNFPLPIINDSQKRKFHCIALLRRTEIAALRYRPAGSDPTKYVPPMAMDRSLDGARYLSSRSNSLVHLTQSESEEKEILVKDDAKLLYDPFQLVTGNRKVTQLILIQHIILEEMRKFNAAFDDAASKKQSVVQSLDERNKQVKKLVRILKANPDEYPIFEPPSEPTENPDSFLTVRNEEIHLRKGGENMNKAAESTKVVDEDSFGEKALKSMMGSNVSIENSEEAPAEEEPIRPGWMTEKKKEAMTEDEQYQVNEFEKKLKAFTEERERKRKTLSAELVKLAKTNSAAIEEFDRMMCKLYMQRFDAEEVVLYHELEIMHISSSLDRERQLRSQLNSIGEEVFQRREDLRRQQPSLNELNTEQTAALSAMNKADSDLKQKRDSVQKEFKNKDCANQLIHLYQRAYRRIIPKPTETSNLFQQFIAAPFVFSDDKEEIQKGRPPSLPEQSWLNFVKFCDDKLELSMDAGVKASEYSELKSMWNSFNEENKKTEGRIQKLEGEQSSLGDDLLHTLVDMHVPFTFRQGQVEIPSDAVLIDYCDIVLIDRQRVVDRNKLIVNAGKAKVEELEKIKKQHSAYKVLKWELERISVDQKNIENETEEYQLFRPSKTDQELINAINTEGKDRNQKEVDSLTKSLEKSEETHGQRVDHANETLKKLRQKISQKKAENEKIEEEILQMQVGLKERKRIYNIQMKSSEGATDARKRRLKQVMMISRLKRAKAVQETKIAELKEEVSRLRKCVFTSFNEGEGFEAMGYNH